jgi:hypothetical protein
MKIALLSIRRMVLVICVISLWGINSAWAQMQVVQGAFTPGVPLDSSPNQARQQLAVQIQYDNGGRTPGRATTTIQVGAWNPNTETIFQAQNRKARAAAADITAANINGITAATSQRMGWLQSPVNGRWFWGPLLDVTVNGMVIDRNNPTAISTVRDPTREGNGGNLRLQGGGGGGGSGSMYRGSMNGGGSGMSSGVDPLGDPSLFSFGFYSNDGQILDVATLSGASGMTDTQILSTLASQFNTLYGSSGLTASYDSFSDTLSFDQLLDATKDSFYMADTDTGIDFTMSLSTTGTPEPSGLLLLGSGVLGLSGILRKQLCKRS